MKSRTDRKKIHIFSDFDGTITRKDSLEAVLNHFCGTEWQEIEERVTRHELTEKESLQMEMDYLHESEETIFRFLTDHIHIDPNFPDFVEYISHNEIEFTILSGGFRSFIQTILDKYHLSHLKIEANSFEIDNEHWKVIGNPTPKIKNNCNHCKTHHLIQAKSEGLITIYIGDGNTDRCPAQQADIVFAKGPLASYLTSIGKDFFPISTFADVKIKMEELCYNWCASTID
ncbi:MAG: 2-hydroxy-3-keto-5-methylthiopentenyl-1-phosphate phosphatase [Calditrichia bacterium]